MMDIQGLVLLTFLCFVLIQVCDTRVCNIDNLQNYRCVNDTIKDGTLCYHGKDNVFNVFIFCNEGYALSDSYKVCDNFSVTEEDWDLNMIVNTYKCVKVRDESTTSSTMPTTATDTTNATTHTRTTNATTTIATTIYTTKTPSNTTTNNTTDIVQTTAVNDTSESFDDLNTNTTTESSLCDEYKKKFMYTAIGGGIILSVAAVSLCVLCIYHYCKRRKDFETKRRHQTRKVDKTNVLFRKTSDSVIIVRVPISNMTMENDSDYSFVDDPEPFYQNHTEN